MITTFTLFPIHKSLISIDCMFSQDFRSIGDRPPLKHGGFRKSYAKAFVDFRSELDASTEMPTILPSKTIGLMSPKPKEATPSLKMFIAAFWSRSRCVLHFRHVHSLSASVKVSFLCPQTEQHLVVGDHLLLNQKTIGV